MHEFKRVVAEGDSSAWRVGDRTESTDPVFGRVLVANRGEIGVRIVRTCAELGVSTVAIHAPGEGDALHLREADEAVCIDGTAGAGAYLDVDRIVATAVARGCDAVHPGYGFLSENPEFAAAVVEAGLTFVGPKPEAIRTMGDKIRAREVAVSAEVPVVPGSSKIQSGADALAFGEEHGYPILIKASAGGGGRGMRLVEDAASVDSALSAARREAAAAFGNETVYVERYIVAARHVEVQVFADLYGTVVSLGDRDCSVQRRHQKLIEEAPAPGLSDQVRKEMGEAAVRLARAVDYTGAATVEFLYDSEDGRFYFLEMNTRIQVEHPVTESILNVDLIAEQLFVAGGRPLSVGDAAARTRGHAIECRINAEDVSGARFLPAPGVLDHLSAPSRAGVRFDAGYQSGDEVSPAFDSLIGKLIVWAPNREWAITRAAEALRQLRIDGVPTTAPAALAILEHPDFARGGVSTSWLEGDSDIASLLPAATAVPVESTVRDAGDEVWVGGRRYVLRGAGGSPQPSRPPRSRPSRPSRRVASSPGEQRSAYDGHLAAPVPGVIASPMQATVVGVSAAVGQRVEEGDLLVVIDAMKMEQRLLADIAGVVVSVVEVGETVTAGATLVVIDAS